MELAALQTSCCGIMVGLHVCALFASRRAPHGLSNLRTFSHNRLRRLTCLQAGNRAPHPTPSRRHVQRDAQLSLLDALERPDGYKKRVDPPVFAKLPCMPHALRIAEADRRQELRPTSGINATQKRK